MSGGLRAEMEKKTRIGMDAVDLLLKVSDRVPADATFRDLPITEQFVVALEEGPAVLGNGSAYSHQLEEQHHLERARK